MLWALLAPRIEKLGVGNVRERRIVANRADFYFELPHGNHLPNPRLAFELKVAGKGRGSSRKWLIDSMDVGSRRR